MILINAKKIKIDTMKSNTGAFFGNTFAVNWSAHFKENVNISKIGGNQTDYGSVNIINDCDGIDSTGFFRKTVNGVSSEDNRLL